MSCSKCNVGLFINASHQAWLNADLTTANGIVIAVNANPSFPGITISKGASSIFFALPTGGAVKYMRWGTTQDFIAILTIQGGVGPATRSVVLVNTSGSTLTSSGTVINVSEISSVPLPFIDTCPGDGSIIMVGAPDGSTPNQWNSVQLLQAATGNSMVGAGSLPAIPQLNANITTTRAEIRNGTTVVASAELPEGESQVTPDPLNFVDAVVGAGVAPALATSIKQATIKNTGNNCMTVTNLVNTAHYSMVPGSNSKPFPVTLQAGENFHFDILFNPVTIGTFNEDMPIIPAPVQGDTVIHCRGKARAPHLTISFTSPVAFGRIPLGSSSTRNLVMNNTGEATIVINFPPPTAGSPFQWTAPAGAAASIAPGGNTPVQITYIPITEGNDSRVITFSSTAQGSPHSVSLTGTGCVANAVISLPNSGPVDMGNVQRGFRTVRMFTVRNTGDGLLLFNAQIVPSIPGNVNSMADAALFGLLQDNTVPVTSPQQSFPAQQSVNPVIACGSIATGSGEFVFGISFFGNDVPRTVNANLEIFGHNDTSPGVQPSFIINLTAAITAPIAIDVELVIDRSGSMANSSGLRNKIDVATDAAKLFVALSRPDIDDRLGIVTFDDQPPEIVAGIQNLTAAIQAGIITAIDPASAHFVPRMGTSIAGGVMVAQKDISTHPRATAPDLLNKVIVVLTDGADNRPYTNPDDGLFYSITGGVMADPGGGNFTVNTSPLPIPADVKVYAVGIGDDIDSAKLDILATSSGGTFLAVREFSGRDYFNLEKHFTQVYMEAVNYAPISDPVFEINAGETHSFHFEVLDGDKSAMVVIYDKDGIRIPFFITSPSGEMIDLLTVPAGYQIRPGITTTARFIEINMPQGEPDRYAGTWTVLVKHDGRICRYLPPKRERNSHVINPEQGPFGPGFQPTDCKVSGDPILYGIALGVGSNFNMTAYVSPGTVNIGQPVLLTGMLSEFGLPVKGGVIEITATKPDGTITHHQLYDDGNHQDDQANDGTYAFSYPLTSMAGNYSFTFTAFATTRDDKQVKRELVRTKHVKGPGDVVTGNPDGPGNTHSGNPKDCCSIIQRYLKFVLLFMLIIFIVLVLILLKKQ